MTTKDYVNTAITDKAKYASSVGFVSSFVESMERSAPRTRVLIRLVQTKGVGSGWDRAAGVCSDPM